VRLRNHPPAGTVDGMVSRNPVYQPELLPSPHSTQMHRRLRCWAMANRTAIRRRIRFAVACIGMWVLLLDAALGLALLVKGVPRQVVWREGHFIDVPVAWTPQDTAIVSALVLLQPFVFVFFKMVLDNRARAKSGSMG
jgi:hypothetical protein